MKLSDLPTVTVSGIGDGDRDRDELVSRNQRIVSWARRRFRREDIEDEDVEQAARLALTDAATGYVPGPGRDFGSYAIPFVRAEVRRAAAGAVPPGLVGIDRPIADERGGRDAGSPEFARLREWLRAAIDGLDETSRYVLRHRYPDPSGPPRPVPVSMLAFRLRVSPERVEQIERDAIAALRELHAHRKGA